MLIPKLKQLFGSLNITSTCCVSNEDDDYEEAFRQFVFTRIQDIDKELKKCQQHRRRLMDELRDLLDRLDRMSESPGSSNAPSLADT